MAAAAERQGGFGKICAGHTGKNCNSLDITRLLNLTDSERESIITAPLTELLKTRNSSGSGGGGGDGGGFSLDSLPDGGLSLVGGRQLGAAQPITGADTGGGRGVELTKETGDAEMTDTAVVPAPAGGAAAAAATAGLGAGVEVAKGAEQGGNAGTEGAGGLEQQQQQLQRERPEGRRSHRIAAATPEDIAALAAPNRGFTSLILAAPALDPTVGDSIAHSNTKLNPKPLNPKS